ncbi:HAD family hydrolase [Brevibacillus brevis]|uniref:HAD family hydrolase n=1 Tax=Brevibacillus brevis TaxID=1393 RepID=UPI001C8DC68E|nr:HAD family hydrolase [Brevibacillus brevis]MBY0087429.1 HAD family hydrolase [Brevibacillus brevis]
MNQIRGILFDKDGTLIDFHTFFVQVANELVDKLVEDFHLPIDRAGKEELLEAIGLTGGQVDPQGILSSGTSRDISVAFFEWLQKKMDVLFDLGQLYTWIHQKLFVLTKSNGAHIIPTTDLTSLFSELRRLRIKIGVATADDLESTLFCLETLGIREFVDFIGTSDYYSKKPDPHMLNAFCEMCNLHASEVAVAGDTVVDMLLAKNGKAALAIGVLSGVSTSEKLESLADIVLPSVGDIVRKGGALVWEGSETSGKK